MKAGIATGIGFWAAVAVFGFWGWVGYCLAVSAVLWATSRKGA